MNSVVEVTLPWNCPTPVRDKLSADSVKKLRLLKMR
jgi:hypothetical protein